MPQVKKIIDASIVKDLRGSLEIERNVLLKLTEVEEDEYGDNYLGVFNNEIKIAEIDDYWVDINMHYAIKLGVVRECYFIEEFGKNIRIEINLESNILDKTLDGIGNYAGIYGIVDKRSNCLYVGQSSGIKRRIKQHFEDLSIGFHHNTNLQDIYLKNKFNSFDVVILDRYQGKYKGDINDRKWLETRERFWINHYTKINLCLNKTKGEFVETIKTRKEKIELDLALQVKKEEEDRLHDIEVKNKKIKLKNEISLLQKIVDIEDVKLRPLRKEVNSNKEWLLKNSSWFSFFDSKDKKNERLIRLSKIEKLELLLESEGILSNQSMRQINILRKQLRKLKTSKQLNYAAKQKSDKLMRMITRGY